jgi:hypothetical protein
MVLAIAFQRSRNVDSMSGRPDESLAKRALNAAFSGRNFIGWFGIYGPGQ